ncbi:hypothetical protein [Chroococcidiopsis sp.]|uniref:hypothetical protein n=1 Tax=Chroococcidiopsis sp. TaxID=3088168 RepID=UPI003F30987D
MHDKAFYKNIRERIENRVGELRVVGYGFNHIQAVINREFMLDSYSASQVRKDYDSYIAKTAITPDDPDLAKQLEIELQRLDSWLEVIHPKIQAGDLNAIDRALKIELLRVNLLGFNAPVKVRIKRAAEIEAKIVLNALFRLIAEDNVIPDEHKQRIFQLASRNRDALANAIQA